MCYRVLGTLLMIEAEPSNSGWSIFPTILKDCPLSGQSSVNEGFHGKLQEKHTHQSCFLSNWFNHQIERSNFERHRWNTKNVPELFINWFFKYFRYTMNRVGGVEVTNELSTEKYFLCHSHRDKCRQIFNQQHCVGILSNDEKVSPWASSQVTENHPWPDIIPEYFD